MHQTVQEVSGVGESGAYRDPPDMEADPYEVNDLALSGEHASISERLHQQRCKEFAYPVVINKKALTEQAEPLEELGGIDGIYQLENYDYTPVFEQCGEEG